MKNNLRLICLISILILNISCIENKTPDNETNKLEIVITSKNDTLKYRSGIRSIFQDSKGNYWFGSLQEGVAVYNGKSFAYFTKNDGLTDNQIHSIQEDNETNRFRHTFLFSQIRATDQELLVRASLHAQSRLLKLKAKHKL